LQGELTRISDENRKTNQNGGLTVCPFFFNAETGNKREKESNSGYLTAFAN